MRRKFVRAAGPNCTQRTRKLLVAPLARPGECIDFSALMNGYLGNNMSCRSEAVNPKACRIFDRSGHDQETVTNQTRTEERGCFDVVIEFVEWETIGCLRHREFSVAAINGVPGEPGLVAEVFPVGPTV